MLRPTAKQFGKLAGLVLATLLVGVLLGVWLTPPPEHAAPAGGQAGAGEAASQIWTCSMHPQIRQNEPGDCPLCGMDLIPSSVSGEHDGPARELILSTSARALAQIQSQPAEHREVFAEVRTVGKVDYDETRLAHITAWVPGRLDRLFVDYTGIRVRKGDHLVKLYSPAVMTAQQELLQAIRTADELRQSDVEMLKRTAAATVAAAREKLRLWGLTPEQIQDIEQRGESTDHITIYAPASGVVVHKNAVEGMYVQTGTRIYTIADLSRVWVKLQAYESDLNWLYYGQQVEFSTETYPGEVFAGRVAFIDPVMDERTRTVNVRVNLNNQAGRLKPGMFVRATIRARVNAQGQSVDTELAGKYISPMHPEIIKDEPGTCDVCGMDLVKVEEMGIVAVPPGEYELPLVIPISAPLITGKRAVVYVQSAEEAGRFTGREIVLGPRAGDYYVVESGLAAGELVVTNGNFKIDSALQIVASPSMMSPEGGVAVAGHAQHGGMAADAAAAEAPLQPYDVPSEFAQAVAAVFDAYNTMQEALANDAHAPLAPAGTALLAALAKVDMQLLEGEAHLAWMQLLARLQAAAEQVRASTSLAQARTAFAPLSEAMIAAVKQFGDAELRQRVVRFHCPMALDDAGADWLQDDGELANPYYGEMMLKCGEKKDL